PTLAASNRCGCEMPCCGRINRFGGSDRALGAWSEVRWKAGDAHRNPAWGGQPMYRKALGVLVVATLVGLTAAPAGCARGRVFSLAGGSQVTTVKLKDKPSFNFTNSAFLDSAAPPTFPNGNICVNVYAYDPTQAQLLCCSCLVRTFQTVNLAIADEFKHTKP